MTTQTAKRAPEAVKPKRGRMLWMIALIVVLIIALGVAVWFLVSDDGTPTARFDGEVATYDGPDTLEAGSVTVTLDATEYEPEVMFAVAHIVDDNLTMEDFEALADEYTADEAPPGVFTEFDTSSVVTDEVLEHEFTLTEGRWLLVASTAPDGTNRVHPAAILEVTAAD
jgi:hypothetical protein